MNTLAYFILIKNHLCSIELYATNFKHIVLHKEAKCPEVSQTFQPASSVAFVECLYLVAYIFILYIAFLTTLNHTLKP